MVERLKLWIILILAILAIYCTGAYVFHIFPTLQTPFRMFPTGYLGSFSTEGMDKDSQAALDEAMAQESWAKQCLRENEPDTRYIAFVGCRLVVHDSWIGYKYSCTWEAYDETASEYFEEEPPEPPVPPTPPEPEDNIPYLVVMTFAVIIAMGAIAWKVF